MIDKKNLIRFISCTQEQYDNRNKDTQKDSILCNTEKEIKDGNNTEPNIG